MSRLDSAWPSAAAILMMVATVGLACRAGSEGGGEIRVTESTRTPYTGLEFKNDPNEFQFAIVGDRQGMHRPGVFATAVTKLNALRPEFVMSVGDLVTGYVWEPEVAKVDAERVRERWEELDRITAGLEMPFFRVPGNNDINSETALRVWEERHGPPYYSFVYRDVLLVVLNSDDPPAPRDVVSGQGGIGPEQMDWLASALAAEPDTGWVLLFLHRPMWLSDASRPTWDRVRELLGERRYAVFAGHHHQYRKETVGGRAHYMLATTGGMSDLRGVRHGEFDHVMWVTMTDAGPVIANIMLDGLWGDDPVGERGDRGTAPQ